VTAPNVAAEAVRHWTREVATLRGDLMQTYQPSMRQRIDMDLIWRRAVEEAALKLSTYSGNEAAFDVKKVVGRLGSICLFDIGDLCGQNFKFDGLIERLRAHLAIERSP
jgi:hypothetical protein